MRACILIGLCFLHFTFAAPLWPADPQKLEKLVIGYPAPVASLGIIDVMRKAGLFKKYGLDIDLVYIQGSPILTAAMVSGPRREARPVRAAPRSLARRSGGTRVRGHSLATLAVLRYRPGCTRSSRYSVARQAATTPGRPRGGSRSK